jgi:hypothetical protein
MDQLRFLLLPLQLIGNCPHTRCISPAYAGKLTAQTIQFITTLYAETAGPINRPPVIVLCACGLYILGLLEIALDILIEIARARHEVNPADGDEGVE